MKLADQAQGKVADLPISTHFAGEPALKTTPLPVNVVRTFELRAIPFDAGFGLDVNGGEHG